MVLIAKRSDQRKRFKQHQSRSDLEDDSLVTRNLVPGESVARMNRTDRIPVVSSKPGSGLRALKFWHFAGLVRCFSLNSTARAVRAFVWTATAFLESQLQTRGPAKKNSDSGKNPTRNLKSYSASVVAVGLWREAARGRSGGWRREVSPPSCELRASGVQVRL